jgi:hypothetical protein
MTQVATRFYQHGTGAGQRSTARQLIAAQHPTQRALDQTVELYDERDIIVKTGRYGETIYVRSSISPVRYLPILHSGNGDYKCTCGKPACEHILQAVRYLKYQEVA